MNSQSVFILFKTDSHKKISGLWSFLSCFHGSRVFDLVLVCGLSDKHPGCV